jgi:hypothetical protein
MYWHIYNYIFSKQEHRDFMHKLNVPAKHEIQTAEGLGDINSAGFTQLHPKRAQLGSTPALEPSFSTVPPHWSMTILMYQEK